MLTSLNSGLAISRAEMVRSLKNYFFLTREGRNIPRYMNSIKNCLKLLSLEDQVAVAGPHGVILKVIASENTKVRFSEEVCISYFSYSGVYFLFQERLFHLSMRRKLTC